MTDYIIVSRVTPRIFRELGSRILWWFAKIEGFVGKKSAGARFLKFHEEDVYGFDDDLHLIAFLEPELVERFQGHD